MTLFSKKETSDPSLEVSVHEAELSVASKDALAAVVDPEFENDPDCWTDEDVEAFFSAPLADPSSKVTTVEPLDTISGYAPETFPEAQAQGLQFDKPGKVSLIASGATEELQAKADQKERQKEVARAAAQKTLQGDAA